MLHSELIPVTRLADSDREAMFGLMVRHYYAIRREQFERDLAAKQWVLLLNDERGVSKGFSTLQVYERQHRGEACRILYSGDTVIDRAHWGEQELAFNWIRLAGHLWAAKQDRRLYWFLISKGHRTFRYLPTFARTFLPHWSNLPTEFESSLLERLAEERFGEHFQRERGIVRFASSQGHLQPDLALISEREQQLDCVRFFLERNPGYADGDELCCLCALQPDNLKPLSRRLFLKGAQEWRTEADTCPA